MVGKYLMFIFPIPLNEVVCVCVTGSRALDPAVTPGSHRWLLPEQSRVEKGPKAFAIFLL